MPKRPAEYSVGLFHVATDICLASGSTFAMGTTTVTATDATGNSATGSFTVTVNDVTAPRPW
jgi:hypothetical protein